MLLVMSTFPIIVSSGCTFPIIVLFYCKILFQLLFPVSTFPIIVSSEYFSNYCFQWVLFQLLFPVSTFPIIVSSEYFSNYCFQWIIIFNSCCMLFLCSRASLPSSQTLTMSVIRPGPAAAPPVAAPLPPQYRSKPRNKIIGGKVLFGTIFVI